MGSEISNALELELHREFARRLDNFKGQQLWIDDAIGGIVHQDPNLYSYVLRVKDISSVLTKIDGKIGDEKRRLEIGELHPSQAKWVNAKNFNDFEALIDDWVGCRVIAYLHDSILPLHQEIISHQRFKIIRVTIHDSIENPRFSDMQLQKGRDERRMNHNGYVGIHYIIEPVPVDPCWGREPKLFHKFELQVRTLLQEAWGQIQHAVIYKGRMPDYIKQERSDAFGGLAGFLSQCDVELARLAKDPVIKKLAAPRKVKTRKQLHLKLEKPKN
ncbi:hypothetical protein H8K33_03600 [Undibacterium amnicola]|uniref:RelA/SpoT domain-containing protein n=1 Tax=Undibacterium amnicola TaxID=1834038 RepID=A0ABR6XME0_9BURK|nr:hypothetical protein [Undibacterium amnicola]MBC3830586.1 hypothetical protein [Undibacterium amnicola]